MDSGSRSSPTRITSGSSRSALRSPRAKLGVLRATSRWVTSDFTFACRNSIGSSMVRMCLWKLRLMWSTIEASVLDLPVPGGPVTSTSPRWSSASRATWAGRPSCSSPTIELGRIRNAPATPRDCS